MLIDALQHLQVAEFRIKEYQYTGMGSYYFVDFILFHKWLGITDLLSAEKDQTLEKRVQFNKPFSPVNISMSPIGDLIPQLDPDTKHLLWLDYESELTPDYVQDMVSAGATLSPGSILLVSLNADSKARRSPDEQMRFLKERAGEYFDPEWEVEQFSPSALASTIGHLLLRIIRSGLAPRRRLSFEQLFGFEYADGQRMVTIGGVVAGNAHRSRLKDASLDGLPFIRTSPEDGLFRIVAPRLTRRERLYMDKSMPCAPGWTPGDFELSVDEVDNYRQVYRYLPTYAELLL